MDSYDKLKLRPGQELDARTWNRAITLMRQATYTPGRNIYINRFTKGTVISAGRGHGGGAINSGAFLLRLEAAPKGVTLLAIGRGLIGGLMPQVQSGGKLVPIFDPKHPDAVVPSLEVKSAAFSGGLSFVLAKVNVVHGGAFFAESVEIVCRPEFPKAEPYTAFKLLGWLSKPDPATVRVIQTCYHSQTFTATNINVGTGSFRAWFIAT